MPRRTLSSIAALVLLLGAALAAHGQEPKPARLTGLGEEGLSLLSYAWRYHPGDDPRWADPAFDDAGWEPVEPQMPAGSLPRHGWTGTGWFRRHLVVDPSLRGRPLVIRVATPGATAVFLDGAPLMDTAALGVAPSGGAWRKIVFSPRSDHLLAVRHTISLAEWDARSGNPGFLLTIETPDTAELQATAEGRRATRSSFFTVAPAFLAAFLALFHLALFLFYPKIRENLFYALAMAALAGYTGLGLILTGETTTPLVRLCVSFLLAAIFLILLTYYAMRTRTFPRTWIAAAAIGAALVSLAFLLPDPPYWLWCLYFGIVVIETIRVEISGATIEREGIQILLGGFVILAVLVVLQALLDFGLVAPVAGLRVVWVFGMIAFAVAMSLFLALSFGRTNLHLERRLDEVRDLSEQVLAQERAAHEQELHRRLLEAENARSAAEIEAARALQLSMLPVKMPAVEGLETAAVMATASEVGGDYYDFRVTPDGGLVVAFGDATGHGVAAGIMVTAVKALFSTLGGRESLPAVLAECDRVLREMQVRPFHMCLALARLTPRSITISSAAMPPVLIHRAGSGAVEELGTGGRPIGSRLSGAWSEHTASLAPGDTLLFASDGFAEQLDPTDRPLGYEALAEILRASAAEPAAELARRLLARVAAWRGEREQGDDVTFVVVRVTG
jgi:serine phosphatase RsbU (regulator of sigma subunit)